MASAVIRAPETVQVENEKIDANEMEPLTKGVVFTSFVDYNPLQLYLCNDR